MTRNNRIGRWRWTVVLLAGVLVSFAPIDAGAMADEGRTVRGRVTYDGPIPEPIPVPEAASSRPVLEVEARTKGLRGVVVWLDGAPAPAGWAGRSREAEPVVVDQQNFEFLPHVIAVAAGRPVEFRNSDTANHGVSAGALDAGNRFNVVTPAGGAHTHRFTAARTPIAIGCPIHPSMAAWVFAFDHPHFAVTDERGEFSLAEVPPGSYTLQVRQPDGGFRQSRPLTVGADAPEPLEIPFHAGDLKGAR